MHEEISRRNAAFSGHRISDVARLVGVSPSTLRLWEQHALISPERLPSGQRIYSEEDLRRSFVIRRMRAADGLSMAAIRQALARTGADVAPPRPAASQEAGVLLGRRFKAARRRAGFSLRAAAGELGLSPSFLSTFERTSRGATVATLKGLAELYGTTVTELYKREREAERAEGGTARRTVVPAGEELVSPRFSDDVEVRQLTDNLTLLDCQKWTLQPGAGSSNAYSHEGEEFIHVLSGAFEVRLTDGRGGLLGPGDSISFASSDEHSWKAVGTQPTTVLWVNTPKSF